MAERWINGEQGGQLRFEADGEAELELEVDREDILRVTRLRCGSGGAVQTARDSASEPNTHDRARWAWGLGSPPVFRLPC